MALETLRSGAARDIAGCLVACLPETCLIGSGPKSGGDRALDYSHLFPASKMLHEIRTPS